MEENTARLTFLPGDGVRIVFFKYFGLCLGLKGLKPTFHSHFLPLLTKKNEHHVLLQMKGQESVDFE